jgi:hypothetical protein
MPFVATNREDVEGALEQAQARLFGLDLSSLGPSDLESAFEGVSPPPGLLTGSVGSSDELVHALDRIDLRWRLDAVMAVDDYTA